MRNLIKRRAKQFSVVESSTLFRKFHSNLKNDWNEIETADNWDAITWAQKRLIVDHKYRFLYCAIPKNASSSLMKAIVSVSNSRRKKKFFNSSRDTIRNYVELNYSLAKDFWLIFSLDVVKKIYRSTLYSSVYIFRRY